MLSACNEVGLQAPGLPRQLKLFHPGENRVERHARLESRKASTGADMFTFAERDMLVRRACDIEAIPLLEDFLVAEIDASS